MSRAATVLALRDSEAVRLPRDAFAQFIDPELGSIDMWSFRALDKAVEAGYRAAAPGVERIKEGAGRRNPEIGEFWR